MVQEEARRELLAAPRKTFRKSSGNKNYNAVRRWAEKIYTKAPQAQIKDYRAAHNGSCSGVSWKSGTRQQ
jgi:hypothetical protein